MTTVLVRAFQIPQEDVAPSEEMIDFLNACPQPWDGDPGGIHISMPDGTETSGDCGDWVVESLGVYRVMSDADYEAMEASNDDA